MQEAWTCSTESIHVQLQAADAQPGSTYKLVASNKRKQWEDATYQEREKLVKQHATARAEAAKTLKCRSQASKHFRFTVRGHTTPELSGSIPSSISEAEPESVLNKIYNGPWAYATDDEGQACINSDPAHWQLILDWLSFCSVPSQPSESFVAECRYWQLDNLLAKMQEERMASTPAPPGPIISTELHELSLAQIRVHGRDGFQAKIRIHGFVSEGNNTFYSSTLFNAFGNEWELEISECGAYLELLSGLDVTQADLTISFGTDELLWKFLEVASHDFTSCDPRYAGLWSGNQELEKIQRHPCIDLHGSLLVTVRLIYRKQT